MATVSTGPLSGRYLSLVEREEIAILHAQDCGDRETARRLGRLPWTVSRELRRNAATRGGGFSYRATTAQWHADRRAKRPKVARLAAHDALRRYVQERLAGTLKAPNGSAVPGPETRWNGRRHGHGTVSISAFPAEGRRGSGHEHHGAQVACRPGRVPAP